MYLSSFPPYCWLALPWAECQGELNIARTASTGASWHASLGQGMAKFAHRGYILALTQFAQIAPKQRLIRKSCKLED